MLLVAYVYTTASALLLNVFGMNHFNEVRQNTFLLCVCVFRIIAMCGDYYIGGRRFSSLSDLIGYYSYVSCLLKGEKLSSPVAPPEVRSELLTLE